MSIKTKCPKCGEPARRKGHGRGVQRYLCKACNWNGTEPIGAAADQARGVDRQSVDLLHAKVRSASGVQRYVITAAQNATPVNKAFLASLLGYCRHTGAQLIVIPYRYKNPTSMWSQKAEHDDWWSPEITPYLLDRRVRLNTNLVLLADIKTQPTATHPLEGFETITGKMSAIIGHPKIELKTVPTPQSRMPKIIVSTGAVTTRNYLSSKAGKKAEHHHSFGAALVEISGKKFHLRQLNALNDGSFTDLHTEYAGEVRRKAGRPTLVMGDTHEEFIDPGVVAATFGPGGIVDVLKPKTLIWHDFHDFFSMNHHHRGDPFITYVKHHTGKNNVETALRGSFAFIDRVTKSGVTNVFIPSNHPDAIARWIKETDPRADPENCVFWAQTFEMMATGSKWADSGPSTPDPFSYWGKQWLRTAAQAVFLSRGDSFMVNGVECGYHGDKGANGARGSVAGYAKIGVRTVTGHGHSPAIEGGAYRVGTNSRLRLGYNNGCPSSWMHADCIIYANGKRSLLFIIDGEWRA